MSDNEDALKNLRKAAAGVLAAAWPGAEEALENADVALAIADQADALMGEMSPETDGLDACHEASIVYMCMLSLAHFCRCTQRSDVDGALGALASYQWWIGTWAEVAGRQVEARLLAAKGEGVM